MNQYAWLLVLGLALVAFLLLIGSNKPLPLPKTEFEGWDVYTASTLTFPKIDTKAQALTALFVSHTENYKTFAYSTLSTFTTANPITSLFVSHEDIRKEAGMLSPAVETPLKLLAQRFKSGTDYFISLNLSICECETPVAPNYQPFFSHFDMAFSVLLHQP